MDPYFRQIALPVSMICHLWCKSLMNPRFKYLNKKNSAAMLAIKTSAGVTPEMNLRNSLHIGEQVGKSGVHPDFAPKADVSKRPK